MKIFTITANVVAVTLSLIVVGGCKKKNEGDHGSKPCLLSTVTITPTGDVENLSYDNQNRLILMRAGALSYSYEYGTNTTTVTQRDSGEFEVRIRVDKNTQGLATNVRTEQLEDGSVFQNTRYTYDGEQLIRSAVTTSGNADSIITTYTWSNGNVVSAKTGTGPTRTFDYYTDKLRQDGDFLQLQQLITGFEIYRTKNLVKSFDSGSFTYSFDATGKIRSVNITSEFTNDATVYKYGYQCD